MLKHDVRKTFYPDNPEAHEGMVEILEVMVETWAPELQAKFAAEAVEETRRTERRAAEVGKIETLCEVLGIGLTDERRQQLATLDLAGLQAMLASLKAARAWPRG